MNKLNLSYKNGEPAWEIEPPEPEVFKGVNKVYNFRLFCTPDGALISGILRLYDMPQQPYMFHRLFDLSDNLNKEYLAKIVQNGKVLITFKKGDGELFSEYVSVDGKELESLLQQGEVYNAALIKVSGETALTKFSEAFKQYFPNSGAEGSWDAMYKYYRDQITQGAMVKDEGLHAPSPTVRTPSPKKWRGVITVVALALVVITIAWLIAGRGAWLWVTIIGGILLLGSWYSIIKGRDRYMWPIIGLLTLLWGAWLFIGIQFPIAYVYIDNYSGYNVRLKLNGKDWVTINQNTGIEKTLRKGEYNLVVVALDDATELRSLPISVSRGTSYVLNVLGKMTYYSGTAYYGHLYSGGGNSHETTIRDEWFMANQDYVFEEPPSSVSVSKGSGGTTKTYLKRGGIATQLPPEELPPQESPPE